MATIFDDNSIGNYDQKYRMSERSEEVKILTKFITTMARSNPEILMDAATFDLFTKVKYRVHVRHNSTGYTCYEMLRTYIDDKYAYKICGGDFDTYTEDQLYNIVKYEWRAMLVDIREHHKAYSDLEFKFPSTYREFTTEWVYNYLSNFTTLEVDENSIDYVNSHHGEWISQVELPTMPNIPKYIPVREFLDEEIDGKSKLYKPISTEEALDMYHFASTNESMDSFVRRFEFTEGEELTPGNKNIVTLVNGARYEVLEIHPETPIGRLLYRLFNSVAKISGKAPTYFTKDTYMYVMTGAQFTAKYDEDDNTNPFRDIDLINQSASKICDKTENDTENDTNKQ